METHISAPIDGKATMMMIISVFLFFFGKIMSDNYNYISSRTNSGNRT